MTDVMSKERDSKRDISYSWTSHIPFLSFKNCKACQTFKPLVPSLLFSVKGLHSMLTRLAQAAYLQHEVSSSDQDKGKNAYAMPLLRRFEMKLEGRDIADNSIPEQVDYLLKQATSVDNLAICMKVGLLGFELWKCCIFYTSFQLHTVLQDEQLVMSMLFSSNTVAM